MDSLNEDIVFRFMKDIARKNNGEASGHALLSLLAKNRIKYNNNSVRKVLVSLSKQGRISFSPNLPFCWTVNVSGEELEMEHKASIESNVTVDKIRFIIRKFYTQKSEFPKPNDIENMFWKEYGKPTVGDFTRYLRKLVEDKQLLRTWDFRYYYNGIVQENTALKLFVKQDPFG